MRKKIGFKNGRATIQKANPEASRLLQKLRSFLDENEPQLVYFLQNLWGAQGRAITYKEIREAILSGDIKPEWLEEWQQDYSRFVTEYMEPAWRRAIEAGAEDLKRRFPDWYFDPMADGVRSWVENRGAAFVTNSTNTQIEGIRAVIQKAVVLEEMSVDTLARAIRPLVGLTWQQGIANMNYFETLIKNGTSEKKALDLAARYGARQSRYRGYNIARTETAFAYNHGYYEGTKQAQAAGYFKKAKKVWLTAADERTCPQCAALEGVEVDLDDDFDFPTKLVLTDPKIRLAPPAHPSCRCSYMVVIEE